MTSAEAWDKLRPFCPSIAHLIEDATVSEIEVNPSGFVYVERRGVTSSAYHPNIPSYLIQVPEDERETICQHIARMLGKDISEREPLLDARLPDGSRVAAIAPPVSRNWTFTIRKFSEHRFTMEDLVGMGTLTKHAGFMLASAVARRDTILVSGGTSTGKTSVLNVLAAALPFDDRIVVIEDTAELRIDSPNLVNLESREAQNGVKAVTIRELVRQALRFRPDRIILGEVRGPEAFDLLQALNSGHAGSMSTIHANRAEAALHKLALYAMQAALDIPLHALGPSIAEGINIVVQLRREQGRRVVDQILRLDGYDRKKEAYRLQELYRASPREMASHA